MGMQQVASFAAEGYPAQKIASITGISQESIEKVLEQPKMQERIAELKARQPEKVVDDQYSRLEKSALDRLEESVQFAEPDTCLKILDRVQKKKEATVKPAGGDIHNTINYISLALPAHLVKSVEDNKLTMNADGEIVAVGGRSFAAMPSDGVKDLFHKISAQREAAASILEGELIAAEEI